MSALKLTANFFDFNKLQVGFVFIICSIFLFSMKTNAQIESANVPKDWQTYSEQTDYRKTPRYAETIQYAQKLDKASDLIAYQSFGTSGEGRDLPLLIASNDKTFTVESARKKGKAIILIQACIHAGESDGKDFSFVVWLCITPVKLLIH